MITEQYKDTIYFSSTFARDYEKEYNEISQILKSNGVKHGLLPWTKDYWCRDYMPIQLGYEFVQFIYNPDYLHDDLEYV